MISGFNWSPAIGDPSLGGWLTVLLYFSGAFLTYRASVLAGDTGTDKSEIVLWKFIAVGLALLAVNKQLDLQSAFTELGRYLAHQQGWYEARRTIQFAFILGMLALSLCCAIYVLVITFNMPIPTRLAMFGAVVIMAFIVIRAASFHQLDQLIGTSIIGLHWNWITEIGGIFIIGAAAIWRSYPVSATAIEPDR